MSQSPSITDSWFVCSHPNSEAELRLFFFPYAGGGPTAFNTLLSDPLRNLEAWVAHYPGRGSRYKEPPIKRLAALVENLSEAIQPHLDKPFAFFGHSLGGMVAFELARMLRQNKLPQPDILFISACGAPHLPDPNPPLHKLPDPKFMDALQQLGGIPAEVLTMPELMELLLPTLRADFEAAESYHYDPDGRLLDCRIIAFGGLDDSRVSSERLEGWASHTNAGFISQYFPGGHFFINSSKGKIISSIVTELTSFHAKG